MDAEIHEHQNVGRTSDDLSFTSLQVNLATIFVPTQLKLYSVYASAVRLAGTPSFALAFYRMMSPDKFKYRLLGEHSASAAGVISLTGERMEFELMDKGTVLQLAGGTNARYLHVLRREMVLYPTEIYAVGYQHDTNGAWKGGVTDTTQHAGLAGPVVGAIGAFPDRITFVQGSAVNVPSFTLRSLRAMRRIGV